MRDKGTEWDSVHTVRIKTQCHLGMPCFWHLYDHFTRWVLMYFTWHKEFLLYHHQKCWFSYPWKDTQYLEGVSFLSQETLRGFPSQGKARHTQQYLTQGFPLKETQLWNNGNYAYKLFPEDFPQVFQQEIYKSMISQLENDWRFP